MFLKATSIILPIKLLYFKGNLVNNSTQLLWATANEEGDEQFELEGSYDGVNFQTITKIAGKPGRNTNSSYSLTDANTYTQYRLKIIYRNNRILYSSIIRVNKRNDEVSLEYFPNPVQHTLSMVLNSPEKGSLKLRLTGIDGKQVYLHQWNKQQPLFNTTINTQALAPGIYVMEVTIGDKLKLVKKVVKD